MAAAETWAVRDVQALNVIARDVHRRTIDLLNERFLAHADRHAAGDAFDPMPILQGAVAAILEFAMDGTAMSDDEIREDLGQEIDDLIPKVRRLLLELQPAARHA